MGRTNLKLPPKQQQALAAWNRIIAGLNDNGGKGVDCLTVRLKAIEEYQKKGMSMTALAEAFAQLYPHWGPYGINPGHTLRGILKKLYSSQWIPFAAAQQYRVATSWLQSRNLSIPTNPSMIRHRRKCIIHPDRRVTYKALGLCGPCYTKAKRLGIIHLITLPIKEMVRYVLSTQNSDWRLKGPCINHPDRRSYDDTFCAECLIQVLPPDRAVPGAIPDATHPDQNQAR